MVAFWGHLLILVACCIHAEADGPVGSVTDASCSNDTFTSPWASHACRTAAALNHNWFPSPASGVRTYQSWNSMSGFWQDGQCHIESRWSASQHRSCLLICSQQRSAWSSTAAACSSARSNALPGPAPQLPAQLLPDFLLQVPCWRHWPTGCTEPTPLGSSISFGLHGGVSMTFLKPINLYLRSTT